MTFDELPIRDAFQFKWGWPEILTKSGPFTYLNSKGKERRVWFLKTKVLPFLNYEHHLFICPDRDRMGNQLCLDRQELAQDDHGRECASRTDREGLKPDRNL